MISQPEFTESNVYQYPEMIPIDVSGRDLNEETLLMTKKNNNNNNNNDSEDLWQNIRQIVIVYYPKRIQIEVTDRDLNKDAPILLLNEKKSAIITTSIIF